MDGMPSFGGPPDISSSRSIDRFDQSVFQAADPSRLCASAQAARSVSVMSDSIVYLPKRRADIEFGGRRYGRRRPW